MYHRDIYPTLEAHLPKRQVTVIVGMRRVGKSTALKHLMQTIPHDNKMYMDLEKVEWRNLLDTDSYDDLKFSLEVEGLDFKKPLVIGLDEIQLLPEITSLIKYYYDTYNIKFIVTGSSSFYIKNRFTESLAGRKRIFEIYPLSFVEYLRFKEIPHKNFKKLSEGIIKKAIYDKYHQHYEDYITYGGFPEVVLADDAEDKAAYLSDVINSYIALDIMLLSDFNASHDLYRLIHLLTGNIGGKVDASKLSSQLGLARRKVTQYLELLEHTYFIHLLRPYTSNKGVEISKARKLYFADTGLIQAINKKVASGGIFENMVHNQLKLTGAKLQYYQKKSGQEIDFIVNETVAYEVKETPTASDLKKTTTRAERLGLEQSAVIGRHYSPSVDDYLWGGGL